MPLYWNFLKSVADQVSIYGTEESDNLIASPARPYVYGFEGNDTLWANPAANSYLFGGDGADKFYARDAVDHMYGGSGWDMVLYTMSNAGVTVDLHSGTGSFGHAEGDKLVSIEAVVGSAHDDVLYGDYSLNGPQNQLYGRAGNDQLFGRAGDDLINGGSNGGDPLGDHLFGGSGADEFVFSGPDASREGIGVDVIMDFSSAEGDRISLEHIGSSGERTQFSGEATGFSGTGSEVWYEKVISQVHGEVTFLHARLSDGNDQFTYFDILLDGHMDLTANDVADYGALSYWA